MLRQSRRLGSARHWDPTRPLARTAALLPPPPRRHAPALAQRQTPTPSIARHARSCTVPTPSLTTAATGTERPRRIRAKLFNLRPYQRACVDAVLSELDKGEFTRLGVSAPTGSGKTAIFTSLIGQIPPRRHPGLLEGGLGQVEARQVLVVVNSIQLANQTAEAIQRAYPDWVRFQRSAPPPVICQRLTRSLCRVSRLSRAKAALPASQTSPSPPSRSVPCPVCFARGDPWSPELTLKLRLTTTTNDGATPPQTLAYNDFSRLEKFLPESHKAVIVDEAHHAAAASYLEILTRFDPQVETALVGREGGGGAELVVSSEVIDANPQEVEKTITELEEEEEENEGGGDKRVSELDGEEEEEEVDELFPSGGPGLTTLNGDVEVETTSRVEAASDGPVEPAAPPAPSPPLSYIDEPAAVPMLLDPVSGRARVPLLAFTATWGRADGLALGKVFEKIVWHADWLEMVQAKWCVPPRFLPPFLERGFVRARLYFRELISGSRRSFETGSRRSSSRRFRSIETRSTSTRSRLRVPRAITPSRVWRVKSIRSNLPRRRWMLGSRRRKVSRGRYLPRFPFLLRPANEPSSVFSLSND